jgi:SAM-dependent methyltransferase
MHNIDIRKTIDLPKIMLYHEWIATMIYSEGPSNYHEDVTKKVVSDFFDPLNLPKDAAIMDIGSGPGYFLDEMKERGYTNYQGINLSPEDNQLCRSKGHRIEEYDISFFPQHKGYIDESQDFLFVRHVLEHSPYPLFTLAEYNRLLKQPGYLYVEVPAPDCERGHEFNSNHYSILGEKMWVALFQRTGFDVLRFENLEFDLQMPYKDDDGNWVGQEVEVQNDQGETVKQFQPELKPVREKFYCILLQKRRPLDLK